MLVLVAFPVGEVPVVCTEVNYCQVVFELLVEQAEEQWEVLLEP